MKKHSFIALVLSFLCIFLYFPTCEAQAQSSLEIANKHNAQLEELYQPQGSIVTESNTGRILWGENIDKQWSPASMSKLMTVLLAYEAIDEGKFSLDTEVPVTEESLAICANPHLSNNEMKPGCVYTVSELITLIAIPSSAAATYLLADMINPDRAAFVDLLNKRALELNMKNTQFVNPIGVKNAYLGNLQLQNADPDADNLTSAQDFAILAAQLVNKHPDIINHTKNAKVTVKENTEFEETFEGYLHSLPGTLYEYPGVEGIKTGSADRGYNYTATCVQENTRLNEVILGVAQWDVKDAEYKRHLIGNALYSEAFKNYEFRKILEKGVEYEFDGQKVTLNEDLYDCVPKDFDPQTCILNKKEKTIQTGVETDFLPGYSTPVASVTMHKNTFGVIFLIILVGGGLTFIVFNRKKKQENFYKQAHQRPKPRPQNRRPYQKHTHHHPTKRR